MSYFVASDKIPIAQKSISIPAANGVNYNANQEIVINIDENIKFFQPEQTYLEAKVLIKPPTYGTGATDAHPTRLNLDPDIGFQSLIKTIRIHNRQGVLLEEIDNYNTMVAFKYDYETNDSLKNKRAIPIIKKYSEIVKKEKEQEAQQLDVKEDAETRKKSFGKNS